MSARPFTTRPLVIARRASIAAADNLSIALAYEGLPDPRAWSSLADAEACLKEALHLIEKARGPVPPVPPATAQVADAALDMSSMDFAARALGYSREVA